MYPPGRFSRLDVISRQTQGECEPEERFPLRKAGRVLWESFQWCRNESRVLYNGVEHFSFPTDPSGAAADRIIQLWHIITDVARVLIVTDTFLGVLGSKGWVTAAPFLSAALGATYTYRLFCFFTEAVSWREYMGQLGLLGQSQLFVGTDVVCEPC